MRKAMKSRLENLRTGGHLGNVGENEKIILKCMLQKEGGCRY
jgi:hypothetical protein